MRSRRFHSADQSQVVLDIASKLYMVDVTLEYSSKARIREEITSTDDTTTIYLAGWSSSSFLLKKPLLPFVPLFTICITSPKTVYAIYSIYLIATL